MNINDFSKSISGILETINNSAIMQSIKSISNMFSETIFSKSFYELIERERKRVDELKNLDYEAYNNHFNRKITNAVELGKHGWVLSPHSFMGGESELVKKLQNGKTEKSCIKYFFKNQDSVLLEIKELKVIYEQKPNLKLYFDEFENHYKKRDYMASAFFLSGVLENRMKYAFKDTDIKRYSKIIEKGINSRKELYFNKAKENGNYHLSIFIITEFLPSFQEYAKRTFTEDNTTNIEDPANEPQYFNRSWLVHGVRTRKVERYEILQMINALSCLEAIIEELENYKLL